MNVTRDSQSFACYVVYNLVFTLQTLTHRVGIRLLALFPGSPPRAHEYCVMFDPHAIDVRTRGRALAWYPGTFLPVIKCMGPLFPRI